MRDFSVEKRVRKVMNKLSKKDPSLFKALMDKIDEILKCEDIDHYKNLKKPLQYLKRVHVKSSFVLTFRYIKSEDKVLFYDFGHHDDIYKWFWRAVVLLFLTRSVGRDSLESLEGWEGVEG